jgi:hypothetical protein
MQSCPNSKIAHSELIQGGSNMTETNCDLFTHKSSRSYLNHLVLQLISNYDHYKQQNTIKASIFKAIPKFNKGLSGGQSGQGVYKVRRFGDQLHIHQSQVLLEPQAWEHGLRYFSTKSDISALMMEMVLVSETLDLINPWTRLSARETLLSSVTVKTL